MVVATFAVVGMTAVAAGPIEKEFQVQVRGLLLQRARQDFVLLYLLGASEEIQYGRASVVHTTTTA